MNKKLKKIVITPSKKLYDEIKADSVMLKRSVTNYVGAILSTLYKEANIVNLEDITSNNIIIDEDNNSSDFYYNESKDKTF